VTAVEVWVMVVLPLRPFCASVAVIWHVPAVDEAVYVLVTWPEESVVPEEGLRLPHAAGGDPVVEKFTESPDTAWPLAAVTVAVIADVDVPSALSVEGFAATPTVTDAWLTTAEPDWLNLASFAVIVQDPTVFEAVYVLVS
jgi:hypothetical protein